MVRIVVVLLALYASTARADQCQAVDPVLGASAMRLVIRGSTVLAFCEACKDARPGPPETVTSIKVVPSSVPKKSEVQLNGKTVDLAHVYLKTGPSTFTNLGLMLGCGAAGVRGFLDVKR